MKALTIEELKALPIGEWVWIVDDLSHIKAYAQVEVSKAFGDKGFIIPIKRSYGFGYYDTYGTDWLAYKNKEQAEAKGEIMELPCKVGDTVYVITLVDKNIEQCKVTGIHLKDSDVIMIFDRYAWLLGDVFGDRVFLSKSEAEARLKELQKESK